ncbi:PspC domain-containing protein [Nakamurella antarctica]|uniref:PspC domain-containing protein n=1 Tax=Nakamurella antarctica TaxID=1902245 RepID=A0A3G8ZR06_9ACTN|nr:PspC domain-containing protein [Nakamurella antarctica]
MHGGRPEQFTAEGIPRLVRAQNGRVIGGVAKGIADHLRVNAVWVRVAFGVLAVLGGVGVLAYSLLWIFVPQGSDLVSGPVSQIKGREPSSTERRQAVGIAAIAAAVVLVFAASGMGTSISWLVGPLGVMAIGGAFIWREADENRRQRWRRSAAGFVRPARAPLWRVVGGASLVVGGLVLFSIGQVDLTAARSVLVAVGLTLVGVAIIFIPWWMRLVRDLTFERQQLITQKERADIAAHLHDSVLQTLALIQRQSSDSREVLRLARSQERELRAWLYGPAGYATDPDRASSHRPQMLSDALAVAAGEVEDTYAVKVTPVVVGDVAMDPEVAAVVAAAREAMVNAAKHAGGVDISVYAEVLDSSVEVFVRDRGIGFDVSKVAEDRHGLADSIRGRMTRHGGRARITSTPGEGTEVELVMPVKKQSGVPSAGAEQEEPEQTVSA